MIRTRPSVYDSYRYVQRALTVDLQSAAIISMTILL